MVRQVVAFGALFVIVGACGGQSTLSEGDGEPAAGEAGDTGTGGTSSGGAANGGFPSGGVSAGGTSGGGTINGCVPFDGQSEPCAGKQCGEACFCECPPQSACDPVVTYCDSNGFCGAVFPECPECSSASDCAENDVACVPCPNGLIACPAVECVNGRCQPGPTVCPECQEDLHCPYPINCMTCDDGTTSCASPVCDRGQCLVEWPACFNSEPCEGLECGTPCNPCNGSVCEPMELHVCNADGKCTDEPSECQAQCATALDCPPPPPFCADCPPDTCLAVECFDGLCGFVCR